jgi:ABC-2 type transport system ATP-binding protein
VSLVSNVITMKNVSKTFGRTHALDGLDLQVAAGEVHGFLGPNGAGKSTTIRILLGLLRANSGSSEVLGLDPWTDATQIHKRLAYVPGDVALWPTLTGGEVIDVIGRMRGGIDRGRRDALIERFDLDPSKKSRSYSKGNRQKVGLISALASDAELLILDEPTSGLDPLMEAVFKQCISEERARGRSVLLSSHLLEEVEQLCDRVSIIRAGRVVESGTLGELRHLTTTMVRATLKSVPAGLASVPGVISATVDAKRVELQVDSFDSVFAILAKAGIETIEVAPPTLEQLFMRFYENADVVDTAARERAS